MRRRLSPRDPPPPRRWIPRDPNSPGGNRQPPQARGSRGSGDSRTLAPHPNIGPTCRAPLGAPMLTLVPSLRDGGCCTDLRGRRSVGTEAGARGGGAAGGVSWEAPAPWAGTGWARGGRGGGGGSLLLARAGPGLVRCSRPTPGAAPRCPAAPGPAPRSARRLRPRPFDRRGRGGWELGPRRVTPRSRAASRGFPEEIACPGC